MDVDVFDSSAPARWEKALGVLPEERRDVYFTPAYAALYEGPHARARCLVAREAGEALVHVFLERRLARVGGRPVEGECVIAESLYGYGGPLATTDDAGFLRHAHGALEARQRECGVVSEFVRFHPLLDNVRWSLPAWAPVRERETVVIDLECPGPDRERGYSATHRNLVRRAAREGVRVEPTSGEGDARAFAALYADTMRRVGARPSYFFGHAYFDGLRTALGPHAHLFLARLDGRIVAGAVVLSFGRVLHYHLAGSDPETQRIGTTRLLVHEIARWGAARGCRWFHLGGGRTSAPDDALLRFKANFSAVRRAFYIGRGVYDRARHEALRAQWLATNPGAAAAGYFQVYASDEETAP